MQKNLLNNELSNMDNIHRKILFPLFLLCFLTTIFSQESLRDMVCIVKLQQTEEVKKFYYDYGRELARFGFVKVGALLRAKESGGFGSGIVVLHNEKYYVITNSHVVEHAHFVSLEFQTNSEIPLQFKDCKIVARNKDFDLALVEIPENSGIKSGFTFSDTFIKEGADVWSAGFPALGNKPSWQLGKGIISNESVKDSAIINVNLEYLIQHTAQVDAGSSGGALLVVSDKEECGYSIIGINTWKARARENANFAIPSKAVLAFLKVVQKKENTIDPQQQIETNTKNLIAIGSEENYKSLLPFISENYIFSVPSFEFIEMFTNASKDAKDAADDAFRNLVPFEAFRIIIADALSKSLKKSDLEYIDVKEDSTKFVSTASIKGKTIEFEWNLETDNWLLTNSSFPKIKNVAGEWEKISWAILSSVGYSLDGRETNSYSLCFEFNYKKHFAFFFDFKIGQKLFNEENYLNGYYYGISFGTHFQRPFKSNQVQTILFVKFLLGFGIGEDVNDLHLGTIPGLRLAFPFGNKGNFLFLDAEYRFKYFQYQENHYALYAATSMFGLNLGYAF